MNNLDFGLLAFCMCCGYLLGNIISYIIDKIELRKEKEKNEKGKFNN